ncbi:hypothetical protein IWQ60_005192 [Tieghemiomyces parasiticus]|uniref:SHSP domain-containing protein n=1 Tax=Tieghemiomyces parasiticus TaxID=78921 RepID=A0A9W8DT95_9FUNG|nr:hypothetical protein IWQ60_005192 [Tieghemiomyces parasiticus]
MSNFFADRFGQAMTMKQNITVTGPGAREVNPNFQTLSYCSYGASDGDLIGYGAPVFGDHQLIAVHTSHELCHYQRRGEPQDMCKSEPNSLVDVHSNIEFSPDMLKITMKWDGPKPETVNYHTLDGRIEIEAAGEEYISGRMHVMYEKHNRDYMGRSFAVPEGYDAEGVEVTYADGELVACVPKKKNMTSYFY